MSAAFGVCLSIHSSGPYLIQHSPAPTPNAVCMSIWYLPDRGDSPGQSHKGSYFPPISSLPQP